MIYHFGDFRLDPDRFELSRDGVPLKTEPQVMELLTLLVKNHARLLTKEEIYQQIWQGRVVSDSALSSRIKSLRHLLGDSGKAQLVIQTVHRKGFRFISDVNVETEQIPVDRDIDLEHKSHAKPTVAVLPFVNLSPDPADEYFSDGISADIITHLGKHRWLKIIARNTSFGFKNLAMDVRQIGRELDADYVIEGNVIRASDRVRIGVSLVDTVTGFQVWSEQYNRDVDDIFDLQDEITKTITARLEPEIGYAERNKIVVSRPANLEAWDCYQLGIYQFFKFTADSNLRAQELLKEAQALDGQFGEAFAWWAYAVVLGMVYWDTEYSQDLLDKALDACNQALTIDRHNATFHALRARVHLARCEYNQAIDDNQRAIDMNSTFAAAHCGMGDSLAYEGRYEESICCFEKAVSLSPNDPQIWAFYSYGSLALIFRHDFEKALRWAELASAIPNCQYWATAHQIVALAHLGRLEEARKRIGTLLRDCPLFSRKFARSRMFYLKRPEQIDIYLQGLELAGIPADSA